MNSFHPINASTSEGSGIQSRHMFLDSQARLSQPPVLEELFFHTEDEVLAPSEKNKKVQSPLRNKHYLTSTLDYTTQTILLG